MKNTKKQTKWEELKSTKQIKKNLKPNEDGIENIIGETKIKLTNEQKTDIGKIKERKCSGECGEIKSLSEFYKCKSGTYGYTSKCKKCILKLTFPKDLPLDCKKCTKCNEVKPLDEFWVSTKGRFGRASRCQTCSLKPKETLSEGLKRCNTCKEIKTISDFNKNKNNKDGYNRKCRDCEKIYRKQYRKDNEEKIKKYQLNYKKENKERLSELYKQWIENNRDHYNNYQNTHRKKRLREDIEFKILNNLRNRVRSALKGVCKSAKTMELVDCTIEFLMNHLESMFYDDMNWGNYGSYWHVDHIIPCIFFDLKAPEQQKICFHWTNLQPLTAKDNLEKNDNLDWERK